MIVNLSKRIYSGSLLKAPASIQRKKQVSLIAIKICSTQSNNFNPLLLNNKETCNQAVLNKMLANTLFIDLLLVINMFYTNIVVNNTFKVHHLIDFLFWNSAYRNRCFKLPGSESEKAFSAFLPNSAI